jgi:predicted metal-dependent phosphoesterase TrpH
MTNKITTDTHMHSKASDGVWTPREVVANAKAKGLEVIALTDHDTTFGVAEALEAAKEYGIKVIPGIEIDASYTSEKGKVKNIELLGLDVDLAKIQPLVDKRNNDRLALLGDYINGFNAYVASEKFNEENQTKQFKLNASKQTSLTDVINWYNARNLDEQGKAYLNPTPFLSKMTMVQFIADSFLDSDKKALILNGDRTAGEAFKKEYKAILFTERESKPTFYEAIEAVKNASGKAIVAHPGLSKGYENGMIKEWEMPKEQWFTESDKLTPYTFIKDLKAHGLDGVELYNYKGSDKAHAESQDKINEYFTALANKLELMTTYGSDCHGPKGNGPQMGKFGSTSLNLRLLK